MLRRAMPRARSKRELGQVALSDDRIAALNEIAKALTSTLQLPEIMRIVLARIKTLTFAEAISLLLYDAQRDELVFAATETLRESTFDDVRGRHSGIAAWVARSGRSALVNDPAKDPRCGRGSEPFSARAEQLLAVPVKRGRRVVGVIEVVDRYDGGAFLPSDPRALEGVAVAIGREIDWQTVGRNGAAVQTILSRVAAVVPGRGASLLLYDGETDSLVHSGSRQLQSGAVDGLRMSTEHGIAGWVARNRQALLLADASRDPRYNRSMESETHFRSRSMICVPVLCRERLLGVIQVINRLGGGSFDDAELRLVQILADHAAIAIENASLYRKAEIASLTDDLTGLANTRHLNKILPEMIARGRRLAVLVLDFDNFKQVVDRYGHLIGSQTIAQIGRRIGRVIRPGDFAARFGGDEFVVILPDTGIDAALVIAESICAEIAGFRRLEGYDVDISRVTASIGVAAFPDSAPDADGLLHAADAAMYAVKRRGKNGVAVAERGMTMSA